MAEASEPRFLWVAAALLGESLVGAGSDLSALIVFWELSLARARPCIEARGLSVLELVPGILLRMELLRERVLSLVSEREKEAYPSRSRGRPLLPSAFLDGVLPIVTWVPSL